MPRPPRLLALFLTGVLLMSPFAGSGSATAATATGSISGTVSAPEGDDGDYADVTLLQRVASYGDDGTYRWEEVDTTFTGLVEDGGAYSFTGVRAGTYKVAVGSTGPWIRTWYSDGETSAVSNGQATPITLSAGQVRTGVDIRYIEGGSISGHLAAVDGTGVPYATVIVWRYAAADDRFDYYGGGDTDDNGDYTVRGLTSGTYRVQFISDQGGQQWYDGSSSQKDAKNVTVVRGEDTPGVDDQYSDGFDVSGTVHDIDGQVISRGEEHNRIAIDTYRYDDETDEWRRIDYSYPQTDDGYADDGARAGTYAVNGLAPGQYALRFGDQDDYPRWARTWLKGHAPDIRDSSTYLDLTDDVTGQDITLTRTPRATTAPSVSGTLRAGKTLTAKAGTWEWNLLAETGQTYTYAWTRSGSSTVLSTKSTYKVPTSLRGKKIRVKVTFVKPGYQSTSATSAYKTIAR